jgi:hypothetical protein
MHKSGIKYKKSLFGVDKKFWWVVIESNYLPVALGDRSTNVGNRGVEPRTSSLSEKRSNR